MSTKLRGFALSLLATCLYLSSWSQQAAAEDKPNVIRFGYPSVGVGNRPVGINSGLATAHLRGAMEEEFKADGIAIQWSFLRGAGPAVNELFANGLLDFSLLGDLPSVIGRSSGLRYRLLAGQSVRGNLYVSVPADSNVKTVADLRGKRVAVTKGTATHLAGVKILERFGLSEKDVKLINMETNPAQLALTTRDIDAAIGSTDYLRLRDQGVSRILFSTRGNDVSLTSNSTFLGSDEFLRKYPQLAKRVLKVLVKQAQWLAETPPTQIFQLWTKSGTTFSSFREDLQSEDFKYRYSPLLDEYISARYKLQIQEAKRFNLVRETFDFDAWKEPRFLEEALKELKLESYWQPRDAQGKPRGDKRADNAPLPNGTAVAKAAD
jgi:sulfonate transport system substrate-binding protein